MCVKAVLFIPALRKSVFLLQVAATIFSQFTFEDMQMENDLIYEALI